MSRYSAVVSFWQRRRSSPTHLKSEPECDPVSSLFKLCSLNSSNKEYENILREMQELLQKDPSIIHSVNSDGQTVLHAVCSNPSLVTNIKLVGLLVKVSENVEGIQCNQSKDEYRYETPRSTRLTSDSMSIKQNDMIVTTTSGFPNVSVECNNDEKDVERPRNWIAKRWTVTTNNENRRQAIKNVVKKSDDVKSNIDVFALSRSDMQQPSPAQLVRMKTLITDQLPLHIASRTIMTNSATATNESMMKNNSVAQCKSEAMIPGFVVVNYLIQCHPAAICCADTVNCNLPLHCACIEASSPSASIELVMLLAQKWPNACRLRNRDGNLPLHLASKILLRKNRVATLYDRISTDEKEVVASDNLHLTRTDENDYKDYKQVDELKPSSHSVEYSDAPVKNIYMPKNQSRDNGSETEEIMNDPIVKTQISIIQYLIELYPEALQISNHMGHTPYDVAVQSASSQSLNPSTVDTQGTIESSENPDRKLHKMSFDHQINSMKQVKNWHRHPIIKFLEDPTAENRNDNQSYDFDEDGLTCITEPTISGSCSDSQEIDNSDSDILHESKTSFVSTTREDSKNDGEEHQTKHDNVYNPNDDVSGYVGMIGDLLDALARRDTYTKEESNTRRSTNSSIDAGSNHFNFYDFSFDETGSCCKKLSYALPDGKYVI